MRKIRARKRDKCEVPAWKKRNEEEKKIDSKVNLGTHLPFSPNIDKDGNETGEIKFKFKLDAKVNGRNGVYEQKPVVVDAKRKPMKTR